MSDYECGADVRAVDESGVWVQRLFSTECQDLGIQ